MARLCEFDEAAVLGAATSVVWARGFDAASTQELAQTMGVTAWCGSTMAQGRSAAAALNRFFQRVGRETLSLVTRRAALW